MSLEALSQRDQKSIGEDDVEPFLDKEYRDAYLEAHVMGSIAYQIRMLREQSELSQKQFGEEIGKPQSVISRLEDTEYSGVTINTLLSIAKALGVGLNVCFTDYVHVLKDDIDNKAEKIENIYDTYTRYVENPSHKATSAAFYAVTTLSGTNISMPTANIGTIIEVHTPRYEVVSWQMTQK
jgi:transcriptional regulator with XRE-family HTH domain